MDMAGNDDDGSGGTVGTKTSCGVQRPDLIKYSCCHYLDYGVTTSTRVRNEVCLS